MDTGDARRLYSYERLGGIHWAPLTGSDPRPQYDVRDPRVRERLMLEFGAPPGPDEANVIQFAPPCISHSPWQIHNGGTRTFENLEGSGELEVEKNGNLFGDFTCKGAKKAYDAGKEFIGRVLSS